MKLKRIIAMFIDWNLSGIPALIYSLFFLSLVNHFPQAVGFAVIPFPFFVISLPLIFVYRDVIFRGQSIGKRILKLKIVDLETRDLPLQSKLIRRNVFFFILPVEIILIIIKNQTIGDMITNAPILKKDKKSVKISLDLFIFAPIVFV